MERLFDSMPILIGDNIKLSELTINDLEEIKKMLLCKDIYRYVPPFVPELQCNGDIEYLINTMCKELFEKKIEIILGIHLRNIRNEFCGIFELYNYNEEKKKVSIGARLKKEYWNKGISSEFLPLVIGYLFNQTDITTICASNMVDNPASGRSLEKNGFIKISEGVFEDWGFSQDVCVDKWTLIKRLK